MILTIAKKEWKTLIRSPLTWITLAIIQIVFAWLFLSALEGWLQIQAKASLHNDSPGVTAWLINQCFSPASTLLLAMSPLLTMRLIADERRSSGMELLLSSPISASQIVLGKFIAATGVLGLFVLMLAIMSLSLLLFAPVDVGAICAALLGLMLLAAACCSIGVYFSGLTDQSAIAALGTFGALFLLWVAGVAPDSTAAGGNVLSYLSIAEHLHSFLSGLIDSRDVMYYLLLCGVFLTLCIRHIDNLRIQSR